MKKRSELFFTIMLVPVDLIMIVLAFILAYKFRFYFNLVPATYFEPFDTYFKFVLYASPFWILIFAMNGLYSTERRGIANEFGKICVSVTAAVSLLMVEIFLTRTFFFSRLIIGFAWILAIVMVLLGRYLLLLVQRLLYYRGIGVHKVMVIGNNGLAKSMVGQLDNDKKLGYEMVKLIDRDGIKKIDTIFHNAPVDDILIADADLNQDEVEKVMIFCRDHNLGFKVVPNHFLVQSSHTSMQTLAGIPVLEFKRTPLEGWGRIFKRILDILSSIILIIITSPLMLVVALMVKLTSKGPIFYRADRVGLEKNFIMFKFRTMQENSEKLHEAYIKKYGNMFKLKDDPRMTSIGKFLRTTSLDELPQFFNVFKGDMSLIGPRPPMPEEVARYTDFQKSRLGVKPGITGMWQVSGRSELSFDEWVRLDAYYIEHWSLWLDFVIFLKTIWVVIKGRGAR
jgi:exopolysaccharide biosynthesis polyprenyl glycosylphosphotransferase